ncbi:hypothetical protein MAR_031065 [Mya arenaria]|uniref:Uncharacterized protein n=1 Tax=Mya arenaria TaxID=6604 RepID=A0ABY7F613_MYAAR|nr:hypothetical protein MAR_031065 [Mya arenaria]
MNIVICNIGLNYIMKATPNNRSVSCPVTGNSNCLILLRSLVAILCQRTSPGVVWRPYLVLRMPFGNECMAANRDMANIVTELIAIVRVLANTVMECMDIHNMADMNLNSLSKAAPDAVLDDNRS